jgi:predicted acylesterase/phospholipase RssA
MRTRIECTGNSLDPGTAATRTFKQASDDMADEVTQQPIAIDTGDSSERAGPPTPMEFRIGLALAGAISAGAYTAGALDFLVEALEEWEAARGQPGVPTHRTGLKVIAGASAGAITGALGLIALARGAKPQRRASWTS